MLVGQSPHRAFRVVQRLFGGGKVDKRLSAPLSGCSQYEQKGSQLTVTCYVYEFYIKLLTSR